MKLLSFLALLLVGCSGCSPGTEAPVRAESPTPVVSPNPSPTPDKPPPPPKQIDKRWATKFEVITRSINRAHKGIRSYEIFVEYPEIKQRTHNTLKFNRWMRRKTLGYVHEFKSLEERAEVLDRNKKLEPASITEGLKIWSDVYYADERIISLRLTHSVMALGQMHPINYYETINFDLRRGAELKHNDIFKKGYLIAFSSYCRTFVKENYRMNDPRDEWLNRGTEAKRSNFPNWNIVPDGILIAFEDYQIGPHSFGQLELIIPYSELKAVLRPKALTATFVDYHKKHKSRRA